MLLIIVEKKGCWRAWYWWRFDFSTRCNLAGAGITGGGLAMRKGDDYGAIYVYYSDTEPEKIADSFTDFVNGLVISDADF